MAKIKTCEFVSPKHPDKMCDFIADSLLDAYLEGDRDSRVAIEVMGGHGIITISGEVTSNTDVDVLMVVKKIVGPEYEVKTHMVRQSPEIAGGVDVGGAGDQGIMMGYATGETETNMPKEYETARHLCREIYKRYSYDGKVQITLNGDRIASVVASFQNTKTKELDKLVRCLIAADEYFINPAGEWSIGEFEADSGLSGRKIVIDNYGPEIAVGGGSFSGKDATKVDRSAAYMARKISVDMLKKHKAKEVNVKLAYAIGEAEPLMAVAYIDGTQQDLGDMYDLTPHGIKKILKLNKPIFAVTSRWGHFGNGFIWG